MSSHAANRLSTDVLSNIVWIYSNYLWWLKKKKKKKSSVQERKLIRIEFWEWQTKYQAAEMEIIDKKTNMTYI